MLHGESMFYDLVARLQCNTSNFLNEHILLVFLFSKGLSHFAHFSVPQYYFVTTYTNMSYKK